MEQTQNFMACGDKTGKIVIWRMMDLNHLTQPCKILKY